MKHSHNIPAMKPFRRKLRKSMTLAETALWLLIKNKQLNGVRFLRQFSIGNYIVDFYCPAYSLSNWMERAILRKIK